MPRDVRIGFFLLGAILSAVSVRPGAAQSLAPQIEALVVRFESEPDLLLFSGLRAWSSRHQGPGGDYWLGFWPEGLAEGGVLIMTDLDFAYTAPVNEHIAMVPRVGLSVIALGAGSFGGASAGWNVGLGVVGRFRSNFGIRADYTLREFSPGEDPVRYGSGSVGLFWTVARRPPAAAPTTPGTGRLAAAYVADSTGIMHPSKRGSRALFPVLVAFGLFSLWVLRD
jgi:hypothetical protein